jgi:hypothetical protein
MRTMPSQKKTLNRRQFLTFSGAVLTSAQLKTPPVFAAQNKNSNSSPILDVIQANSIDFNGDDIHRPHEILWNPSGYLQKKGGKPKPSERQNIVVVGGGLSGLAAAYLMRDKNPVLLEQDKQLGGNAKGETYKGATYAMGSAYFTKPAAGSNLDTLLTDLDLQSELVEDEATKVNFRGTLFDNFWQGSTAPEAAEQFQKFESYLKSLSEENLFEKYDQISFETWLKRFFPNLHPHIKEYLQLYAWSSFVGSIDEISAAHMLNFIVAETYGLAAFPGGNARIAQRMAEEIHLSGDENSLRSGAFVLDVQLTKEGVEVCYEDRHGQLKTILAEKVIMACPKFVAKNILPQLSPEQRKAMASINYRGYIVANVILEQAYNMPSYELYCLEGVMPESPRAMNPPKRPFTDVCLAGYVQEDPSAPSVLSIYKALPYDGARQFLFNSGAHEKNKNQILAGLPGLLKALEIPNSAVKGIRMTRWGHSLPLAATGMVSSGIVDLAARPIANRIYFVNQDNWVNPSFESGLEAAFEVARILS